MRASLIPYPGFAATAVSAIVADAVRGEGGALALTYVLTGDLAALALPPPAAPVRADGLWKHTCFEAFVRAGDAAAYLELNFAPTTEWAAYAFSGYREGMASAKVAPPRIAARRAGDRFELEAAVTLPLPADAPWAIALTAVIEDAGGAKSYWSLAHPDGRPDFHDSANFVPLPLGPGDDGRAEAP